VRHKGVTLLTGLELGLLHHFGVVLHAFAAGVSVGKLEGVDSVKNVTKPKNPKQNSPNLTHPNPLLPQSFQVGTVCCLTNNLRPKPLTLKF
jgi:hypothetical protein